jgi:hypothetical protein
MDEGTAEPRPAAEWLEALDRLEETLERSLAAAGEPAAEEGASLPTALPAVDAGPEPLPAVLERAERNAAETDTLLADAVDALRRWLEAAAAARGRPLP